MAQVQTLGAIGFTVMAAIFSVGVEAQAGDPGTLIQEKLVSQMKLTKAAADHSDIVTAGDVAAAQGRADDVQLGRGLCGAERLQSWCPEREYAESR